MVQGLREWGAIGTGVAVDRRMTMIRKALPLMALTLLVGCGPEIPNVRMTIEECRQQGGTPVTDPGDGSLHECPAGDAIGRLSDALEGGLCCAPNR